MSRAIPPQNPITTGDSILSTRAPAMAAAMRREEVIVEAWFGVTREIKRPRTIFTFSLVDQSCPSQPGWHVTATVLRGFF